MQTDVIERLDMQVLVELESCIHCLYSAKVVSCGYESVLGVDTNI